MCIVIVVYRFHGTIITKFITTTANEQRSVWISRWVQFNYRDSLIISSRSVQKCRPGCAAKKKKKKKKETLSCGSHVCTGAYIIQLALSSRFKLYPLYCYYLSVVNTEWPILCVLTFWCTDTPGPSSLPSEPTSGSQCQPAGEFRRRWILLTGPINSCIRSNTNPKCSVYVSYGNAILLPVLILTFSVQMTVIGQEMCSGCVAKKARKRKKSLSEIGE